MPSHCSTMFHRWCCMPWIMSCSKPSPYFFLPTILGYRLILISVVQRMLFQMCSGFFRCFWQSLIWPYLHLVVNPLCLTSWSLLFIVDFDSDMSSSWRVFSSWLDVVKGFFLERIEDGEDSLIIQHCCPPWTSIPFYVAELSSVFFLLRIYCWFGS